MLNFKDLTLGDIKTFQPFLCYQKSRTCDYSIGGIFMWRDFFRSQFVIFQNTLILKVRCLSGATAFSVPLGENMAAALEELESYCRETRLPLVYCTVPDNILPVFRERYPRAFIQPSRDWSDYLYRTDDLLSFKGKKYDGQRNHIHKFHRLYPDSRFVEITEENLPRVQEFYRNYTEAYQKPGELAGEESAKVSELLRCYAEYGLFGGFVEAGGKIVSMSVGERVNDTLFVHVEKADIRYDGAYQVTVQEFLKHFARESDKYVNREEDVGDEGLRRSKLSYHPVALLEKNIVLVGPPDEIQGA